MCYRTRDIPSNLEMFLCESPECPFCRKTLGDEWFEQKKLIGWRHTDISAEIDRKEVNHYDGKENS